MRWGVPILMFAVVALGCGAEERCAGAEPGVMISFDDHSGSWRENLDLFARHDARVTFYVSGEHTADVGEARKRIEPLVAGGHSIGVHTVHHHHATAQFAEDPDAWLEEEVLVPKRAMETAIAGPIVTFAYPFGDHNAKTNEVLFEHFDLLRGFSFLGSRNSVHELQENPRFFRSTSIDHKYRRRDGKFIGPLDRVAGSECSIWAATSHHIGEGEWAITAERLEWMFEEIAARGLRYYVPEDFLK